MLRAIATIAATSLREAVRNRVFHGLLAFAFFTLLAARLSVEVTIISVDRSFLDVGISAISLFSAILAIFLGISSVSREVERRSAYTVLARPVSRAAFVWGKFVGSLAVTVIFIAAMTLCYGIEAAVFDFTLIPAFFWAVGGAILEAAVLLAFCTLMSTIAQPWMAGTMTGVIYLSGHFSADAYAITQRGRSSTLALVVRALYYVIPDLERFNFKPEVAHAALVDSSRFAVSTGYALLFVVAFVALGSALFTARDLK